jgi:hypothetical protein
MDETTIEDTPYGRYVVSEGWFVLLVGLVELGVAAHRRVRT